MQQVDQTGLDLSDTSNIWGKYPAEIVLPEGFYLFSKAKLANALKVYSFHVYMPPQ